MWRVPPAVGVDASADALAWAWAWEHRQELDDLRNPHGYPYRVAVNAGRHRRRALELPPADPVSMPEIEPALMKLSLMQRQVVWLVHACEWTYGETAEALEISASAVGAHLTRAMTRPRTALIGEADHG